MTRHCYECTGYWPPVTEQRDGRTVTVHGGRHVGAFVIATSAGRAAQLIEAKYPGMRVDQIIHKGHRELIEEPT